jgi:hypothetical protein
LDLSFFFVQVRNEAVTRLGNAGSSDEDQLQHGDSVEVVNRRTEQKHHLLHHMSRR